MGRVRRTREASQGQWGRKDVPEVRNTQNFTKVSGHRLWLENSVSFKCSCCVRDENWPETDKARERALCHTEKCWLLLKGDKGN